MQILQFQEKTQTQRKLTICYPDKTQHIQFTEQLLQLTLHQLSTYLRKLIRYSTRIFLYKYPVHQFSSLQYLQKDITLRQVAQYFPFLAITFNNTQYSEQKQLTLSSFSSLSKFDSYVKMNEDYQFMMILQICQRNAFVHQTYKLSKSSEVSFLFNIANRYGSEMFIQYYSFRVCLKQFNKKQLLVQNIVNFLDHEKKLTLTVSSVVDHTLINTLLGDLSHDKEKNIEMIIQNHDVRYSVDRRCSFFTVNLILQIIFKNSMLYSIFFKQEHNQNYNNNNSNNNDFLNMKFLKCKELTTINLEKVDKIYIKLQSQKFYPLHKNKLKNVLYLGQKNNKLYFFQQSHILHIFKAKKPYRLIESKFLPCQQTQNNDQDLAYLVGSYLILYNITIKFINLSFFDLRGNFLYKKQYTWPHELYEVQFSVVDMFCVKLKPFSGKIRVFYPQDIEDYYQIQDCTRISKFFPAKKGCDTFSDRSGIFVIADQYLQSIRLFNHHTKTCILLIKYNTNEVKKIQSLNICFSFSKQLFLSNKKRNLQSQSQVQSISSRKLSVQINNSIYTYNFDQNWKQKIHDLHDLHDLHDSIENSSKVEVQSNILKNSQIFYNIEDQIMIVKESSFYDLDVDVDAKVDVELKKDMQKHRIPQNCLIQFHKPVQKECQSCVGSVFLTKCNLILSKNIDGIFLI